MFFDSWEGVWRTATLLLMVDRNVFDFFDFIFVWMWTCMWIYNSGLESVMAATTRTISITIRIIFIQGKRRSWPGVRTGAS